MLSTVVNTVITVLLDAGNAVPVTLMHNLMIVYTSTSTDVDPKSESTILQPLIFHFNYCADEGRS